MLLPVATREKPFSKASATGREKLEIVDVRGQNIEIFIKNIMFQDPFVFTNPEKPELSNFESRDR